MAPENPATNDVQPVRNAASGPNASRKYTYSPPARGRSADSSAYAIAPANATRRRRHLRDDEGDEKNAPADDVRHHDGGTIERAEPPFQRWRRCRAGGRAS